MMKILRSAGIASFLLIGLLGCTSAPEATNEPPPSLTSTISTLPGLSRLRNVTPVGEVPALTSDPAAAGETHLEGQVQQQVPLLNQWLYELTDDSGSIWVLTATPPPAPGESVIIRARIHYEAVVVQGSDIGEHYAEELERQPAPAAEAQES
jgi:hypothetical protein